MALSKDEIRIKCLKLARGMGGGVVMPPEKYVDVARIFEEYVSGSLLDRAKRAVLPSNRSKADDEKVDIMG